MSFELNYKTKMSSSPIGKSKVYFCTHPDDYNLIEIISSDLWKTNNCAVFYNEFDSEPILLDDLFFDNLKQMQLFVIAITDNLLKKESICIEHVIPFALSHNIPVLPIALGQGFAREFNKIFPGIQVLHRSTSDKTSISYNTKLNQYIETTLVGETLKHKISNVFDCNIFLSYRKQDREHAHKIMQFIHENPQYQGVSIWYDEFLIPGDNYTQEISNDIINSDLFILAVTPNLLEMNNGKGNYVMSVEYPLAYNNGKNILPIEMTSTDKGLMKQYFYGIPAIISFNNINDILYYLELYLNKKVKTISDRTPEQNYLLGLAYLTGTFVETNNELALKYLQSCANSNYPEAISKLENMYYLGYGVDRNLDIAMKYQSSLVNYWSKEYTEDRNNSKKQANYWRELWKWGDFWRNMGEPLKAKEQYETMLKIANPDDSETGILFGYRSLGDAAADLGDISNAWLLQSKVVEIARKQFSEIQDFRTYANLYSAVGHLGNFAPTTHEAYLLYKEAYEITKKRLDLFGDVNSRFDFVDIVSAYCSTCLSVNHYAPTVRNEMLKVLDRAIEIGEDIIANNELDGTEELPLLYAFLSSAYSLRIRNSSDKLDRKKTHGYILRTCELLETLYGIAGTANEWYHLAFEYYSLSLWELEADSKYYMDTWDFPSNTEELLRRAEDIILELCTKFPDNIPYKNLASKIHEALLCTPINVYIPQMGYFRVFTNRIKKLS